MDPAHWIADLAVFRALAVEAERVAAAAASAPSAIKIARGRAGCIARATRQTVFLKFSAQEAA